MATRNAIANGNWDAGGTWDTGIPGTGDIADLKGKTVTLRDNRTVTKVISTTNGGRLVVDPILLGAAITLTFDDAVGAGFDFNTNADTAFIAKGTAAFHVKVKSAVANPTNRWAFASQSAYLDLTSGLTYCTFVDFASLRLRKEHAGDSTWTSITNVTFKSNVARTSAWLDGGIRAVNPVFDNVDYLRVPSATNTMLGAFLQNATFINGSLFFTQQINALLGEFIASKDHAGVANDYVIVGGDSNSPPVVAAKLDDILLTDRPGPSDNLKIGVNAAGGSAESLGAVKTGLVNVTVASLDIRNRARVRTGLAELYITGAVTLGTGAAIVSDAGSGRIVRRVAPAYDIWCGAAVLKSTLVQDYSSTDNVTLKMGQLTIDEAAAHSDFTVEDLATLTTIGAPTVTVTAAKTLWVKAGGRLTMAGAAAAMVKLRSSIPGTKWYLKIERGVLFLDRAVLSALDQAIYNFGIQAIQEPVMSYFAMGDKSQMSYMPLDGGVGGWRIMTYSHATNTWSGPYKFDDVNQPEGDGHKYASVIHDALGYIHLFYDSHEEPFKHKKSNNVNDASGGAAAFSTLASVDASSTYPNLTRGPDGTLYLHKRNTSPGSDYGTWFRKSTDNGATWSTDLKIIDRTGFDRSYAFGVRVTDAQTIHIWGNFRTVNQNYNPYYIRSRDGGTTWEKASGATLVLPASDGTIDHPAGSVLATSIGGGIGLDGNPHMVYIEHDNASPSTTNKIKHTRWNGTAWTTPLDIVTSGILPTAGNKWADPSTAAAKAIMHNGILYVVWSYATGPIDNVSNTATGDLYTILSTSRDQGASWNHSVLRKWTGTPTVMSNFVHIREIPEKDEVHLFWGGEPSVSGGGTGKDFLHEELFLPNPHAPRQVIFTYVDVQDSDATQGVPVYAE